MSGQTALTPPRRQPESERRKSVWPAIHAIPREILTLTERRCLSGLPSRNLIDAIGYRCWEDQLRDEDGRPFAWMSDEELERAAGCQRRELLYILDDMTADAEGAPILSRGPRRKDGKRPYSLLHEQWAAVRPYQERKLSNDRSIAAKERRAKLTIVEIRSVENKWDSVPESARACTFEPDTPVILPGKPMPTTLRAAVRNVWVVTEGLPPLEFAHAVEKGILVQRIRPHAGTDESPPPTPLDTPTIESVLQPAAKHAFGQALSAKQIAEVQQRLTGQRSLEVLTADLLSKRPGASRPGLLFAKDGLLDHAVGVAIAEASMPRPMTEDDREARYRADWLAAWKRDHPNEET